MSYYAYMSPKYPHRSKAKNRGVLALSFVYSALYFFASLHEDNSLLIKKISTSQDNFTKQKSKCCKISIFEIQQICIEDLWCALLYTNQIKNHKLSIKTQLLHQGTHNFLSKQGLLILTPD